MAERESAVPKKTTSHRAETHRGNGMAVVEKIRRRDGVVPCRGPLRREVANVNRVETGNVNDQFQGHEMTFFDTHKIPQVAKCCI